MLGIQALLDQAGYGALHATGLELLQVNLGARCNLCCAHCHQSASPTRTEEMSPEVLAAVLNLARRLRPGLVDVTGGAPELHPGVRWLCAALAEAELRVQVRTNLTALLEPGCEDLPVLWARLGVHLLASLPSTDPATTDAERGAGAFAGSIEVLRRLNALGYGGKSALRLDLACNRDGSEPGAPEAEVERRFREELGSRFGVRFDALRLLVDVPVGRFGERLDREGSRAAYVRRLASSFNAATAARLACRRGLAVAWDGRLYDCDFNLGAGLPIHGGATIFEWSDALLARPVALGAHCFACTAAEGSS